MMLRRFAERRILSTRHDQCRYFQYANSVCPVLAAAVFKLGPPGDRVASPRVGDGAFLTVWWQVAAHVLRHESRG